MSKAGLGEEEGRIIAIEGGNIERKCDRVKRSGRKVRIMVG